MWENLQAHAGVMLQVTGQNGRHVNHSLDIQYCTQLYSFSPECITEVTAVHGSDCVNKQIYLSVPIFTSSTTFKFRETSNVNNKFLLMQFIKTEHNTIHITKSSFKT